VGILIVGIVIFCVAILMSMVGRGGGSFYVPILIAAVASMNQAAVQAIKRVGCFPPIPDGMETNQVQMQVAIVFKLK